MGRSASSKLPCPHAMSRSLYMFAIFLFITFLVILSYSLPHSPIDDSPVYFLSVGDFGKGTPAQMKVSKQMSNHATMYGAKFILSVGDNIYDAGVKGVDDQLFQKYFEDVYSFPSLQVPWYMALGDHDHRGSVEAQILYSKSSRKWSMPSPYYEREVALRGEGGRRGKGRGDESHYSIHGADDPAMRMQIIVTDSVGLEGLVALDNPEDRRFWKDYNSTFAGKMAGTKQLQWLKRVLSKPRPAWRMVVGHRPIFSSALRPRYPAEERFQKMLQRLLEKHGVDVYLSGHDHVGQHLEENGVVYIGNGVGGYGNHAFKSIPQSKWVNGNYNGFILHKVTPSKFEFNFVDFHGTVLHKVNLHKNILQQKAFQKNEYE